jgi:hypothetical protein
MLNTAKYFYIKLHFLLFYADFTDTAVLNVNSFKTFFTKVFQQ